MRQKTKVLMGMYTRRRIIDDSLLYYKKHYEGLTRGELIKKDGSLYNKLRKNRLLDNLPTANLSAHAKKRSRFGLDALAYYKKHYKRLTRGELIKKDASLYIRLRKEGLIKNLPTINRSDFEKKRSRIGLDGLAYYKKHYPRLTRGELQKRDRCLYMRLWKEGLLKHVPTARRFIVNPLAYYRKYYNGLTRGEVEKIDISLYARLYRDGLIKNIPTANFSVVAKTKRSRFGLDALTYYKKHYAGLTRNALERKDASLYHRLRRDGLICHVPTIQSRIDNPLPYYRKHYPRLTRGELHKKDRSLYEKLRRDGLLKHVPTAYQFIDNPLEYYRRYYAGLTRGELWRKNKILYNKLWLDGTLKYIPQRYR